MEEIKLNSYSKNNNVYSYNEYNENINEFVKFIYSVIDYCDSFYYNGLVFPSNMTSLLPYKKANVTQSHKYNNEISDVFYKDVLFFNIENIKNKKILKENLRFNISDPDDREPIKISTNCLNIANNDSNDLRTNIIFVKGNKILFNFNLYDGYLYDYSNEEVKQK